jgi:flagellar biogenesis protein FliO
MHNSDACTMPAAAVVVVLVLVLVLVLLFVFVFGFGLMHAAEEHNQNRETEMGFVSNNVSTGVHTIFYVVMGESAGKKANMG